MGPFGTWLCLAASAQKACIGALEGAVLAWTMKRTGEQDMWKRDEVLTVKSTA